MANDKSNNLNKKFITALVIGAVLVCLIIAAAYLAGSIGSPSAQPNSMKLKVNGNISDDQISSAKTILQDRMNALGYNAFVDSTRDVGTAYLIIHYGNISESDLATIATTPGVFEMRVQTMGNGSQHILDASDIKNVQAPIAENAGNETAWGMAIWLTADGKQKFRQACIDSGATEDPSSHNVTFLMDGKTFYSAPLSSDLATSEKTNPVDTMMAMTGNGADGRALANMVYACLKSGAQPVTLEVVSPDTG